MTEKVDCLGLEDLGVSDCIELFVADGVMCALLELGVVYLEEIGVGR